MQEAVLGRLGAQPIVLPPLRERVEDIGRLVAHFLRDLTDGRAFEPEAFHALCLHAWPLNVRELSKVIDRGRGAEPGAQTIGLEHLPDAVTATLQLDAEDDFETTDVDLRAAARRSPPGEADASMTRAAAPAVTRTRRPAPTREELTTLLAQSNGSVAEVARRLNRQYAVIWRCIQRYGIDASQLSRRQQRMTRDRAARDTGRGSTRRAAQGPGAAALVRPSLGLRERDRARSKASQSPATSCR